MKLLTILALLLFTFTSFAAFPIKNKLSFSSVSNTRHGVHFFLSEFHTRQHFTKPQNIRSTAIVLAVISILLGGWGLHRYYLGYTGEGVLQSLGFLATIIGTYLVVLSLIGLLGVVLGVGGFSLGLLFLGCILELLGTASFVWQVIDLVRICTGDLKHKVKNQVKEKYH